MIKKADRDAILAMLEDPMVRYKEILVRLVNALPCEAGTEVPVEEEKPTGPNYPAHEERAWNEAWEKKCLRERGVSPAPDFAAMGAELARAYNVATLEHKIKSALAALAATKEEKSE
jgi:hypothetical protein